MASKIELLQGTLEFLILQALSGSEPRHGFGVLRWIRDVSDGDLVVEEGALYPALHRLERKGWIEAEWGLSEKNRKAKFYQLTASGERQVRRELKRWTRYVDVVERIIGASGTA